MNNIRSAKVIEVIEVVTAEGRGVVGSPIREVTYYYSTTGTPLAHRDPCDIAGGCEDD